MKKQKIKVGLDFDGVVAYNPLRVARFPVTVFKKIFLPRKTSQFFIPKTSWQKATWRVLHESSFIPAYGTSLLKHLVEKERIEVYLVTGRFGYLEPHLYNWLQRYKMKRFFKEIHLNEKNEQPHEFKKRKLEELSLDAFIEDNWNIVDFLRKKDVRPTKVYWVTNILDFFINYPLKHPHLKSALEHIIKEMGV